MRSQRRARSFLSLDTRTEEKAGLRFAPGEGATAIGQTIDVEIAPRQTGKLRLDTRAAAGIPLGSLVLNVSP